MESADVNWLAVVVAALVPMALGAVWYSPRAVRAPVDDGRGPHARELTGARVGYLISAVGALVGAAVLSYVVDWAPGE